MVIGQQEESHVSGGKVGVEAPGAREPCDDHQGRAFGEIAPTEDLKKTAPTSPVFEAVQVVKPAATMRDRVEVGLPAWICGKRVPTIPICGIASR